MKMSSMMIAALALVWTADAQIVSRTNTWMAAQSGAWDELSNWSDTSFYPNGAGDVAVLMSVPDGVCTNTLPVGGVTLGELQFGRAFRFLAGNEFIFDNGNEVAKWTYVSNATATTWQDVSAPIQVYGTFAFDTAAVTGNSILKFIGGFRGDENAEVRFPPFVHASASYELQKNTQFFGNFVVGDDEYGGCTIQLVSDAGGLGGSGRYRIMPGSKLVLSVVATDALTEQFDFVNGMGQSFSVYGNYLKNLTVPQRVVPAGGTLQVSLVNATAADYGIIDSDVYPIALTNTYVSMSTRSGNTQWLKAGTLSIAGQNTLKIDNKSTVASGIEAYYSFNGFSRAPGATLLIQQVNAGAPVVGSGPSTQNRTMIAGLPAMTNSILPPWCVYCPGDSSTDNSYFATYSDTYGIKPYYDMPYTNDFSGGATGVVHVNANMVNAADAELECYALRLRGAMQNGQVTIGSGGLILGTADKKHTATFYFGEDGASDAYIYATGHTDQIRDHKFLNKIVCNDLLIMSYASGRNSVCLGGTNEISGKVWIQGGGMRILTDTALTAANDIFFGMNAKLHPEISKVLHVGGLNAPGNASIVSAANSGSGTETVVLNPKTGETYDYRGFWSDTAFRTLAIQVAGAGVQLFNGVGQYSGGTIVKTGGTFGGSGRLEGALTVEVGGTLRLFSGKPLRVATLESTGSVLVDVGDAADPRGDVLVCTDKPLSIPRLELVGAAAATHQVTYDPQTGVASIELKSGTQLLLF